MSARDRLRWQAEVIERTLEAKKLPVRVPRGTCGYRLTVFELVKPANVDLAAVQRQEDELALALGVSSCRIGRRGGFVTVEIPRPDPLRVDLGRLMEGVPERPPFAPLVGIDDGNTPLMLNLRSPNVAHVLIAGTTGSGKTALARSMVAGLAMGNGVTELSLVLLDPKRRGYGVFAGLPHLAHPVIVEPEEALGALAWAVALMEERDRAGTSSPRVVVFIDELADLIMLGGEDLERALSRLTQRGREAGIHVVACTQKPTAQVIGSLVKANFPARLVGKVVDHNEAYQAAGIGGTGAERLLGKGDFIAVVGGDVTRLQAAWISEAEIERLVLRLRGGLPVAPGTALGSAPRNGRILDFVSRYRGATNGATGSATNGAIDATAVLRDHEAGMSQRELEEKYFGYQGGDAYKRIKAVLESATATEQVGV